MRAALCGRATFMKSSWIRLLLKRLELDEEQYRIRIVYRIPDPGCTDNESCMHGLANILGELTGKAVDRHLVFIPLQVQDLYYEAHVDPEFYPIPSLRSLHFRTPYLFR